MNVKKKLAALFLALCMIVTMLSACNLPAYDGITRINGSTLEEFRIIYPAKASSFEKNAAEYIASELSRITETTCEAFPDTEEAHGAEILVGRTNRELSKNTKKVERGNFEFVVSGDGKNVALSGESFLIGGAAYWLIHNGIVDGKNTKIRSAKAYMPQAEDTKNLIMLIGDGMGEGQIASLEITCDCVFAGSRLPWHGYSITNSLSGTTDSAAGGTALACGQRTYNSYVGKDRNLNDLKSLTELAMEKGMQVAVLSTDSDTGATPAAFSAHAAERYDADKILADMENMRNKGAIVECNLNSLSESNLKERVLDTIYELENENGFFMMYEEGYIDKYCHSSNLDGCIDSMGRFDSVIAGIMEYAMYNPSTAVIITADHETGGLKYIEPEDEDDEGDWKFSSSGTHSDANVPVTSFGKGFESLNDLTQENFKYGLFCASILGEDDFNVPGAALSDALFAENDYIPADTKCGKVTSFGIAYVGGPSENEMGTNEARIKEIADGGFSVVQIETQDSEFFKTKVDPLLNKYNLKAVLVAPVFATLIEKNAAREEIETEIASLTAKYADCDSVIGWDAGELEKPEKIAVVSRIIYALRNADADREVYASTKPIFEFSAEYGYDGAADYEKYVDIFLRAAHPSTLMTSHLGIRKVDVPIDDSGSTKSELHETGEESGLTFIKELSILKKQADEKNTSFAATVLITGRDPSCFVNVDASQINWQANTAFAFGAKRIVWSTYQSFDGNYDYTALIEKGGNPNPHYEYVKKANNNLIAWDKALNGSKIQNITMTNATPDDAVAAYTSIGKFGTIATDRKDLVTSFSDGSVFIVDTRTSQRVNDSQRHGVLTLSAVNGTLQWLDTSDGQWKNAEERKNTKLDGTTYTIKLDSGEGILLRVAE